MIRSILSEERKLIAGLILLTVVYAIETTPYVGPVGHFGALTDGVFVVLLAVIIYAATGVVHHAEALAEIFGEPYGTLILTMTAVIVEVIMLATIMLNGPTTEPTMARDTMYSTVMILLSGLMGLALFVGGLRFVEQEFNYKSSSSFMTTLIVLVVLGFYVPMVVPESSDAVYKTFLIVNSIVLYGYFLRTQTGKLSFYFSFGDTSDAKRESMEGDMPAEEKGRSNRGVAYHVVFLVFTVAVIAILVEFLSVAIDDSITDHALPRPIAALIAAVIIITPEGMTAVRAALNDQMQRAVNIAMGSALSTVALTIPAMLIVATLTGLEIQLALTPIQAILLSGTILVAVFNASSGETNELKGVIHFSLFAAFILSLFL